MYFRDNNVVSTLGSLLRPLFFKIFLIDLFFIIKDFDTASSTEDNTPYMSENKMDGVIKFLEA